MTLDSKFTLISLSSCNWLHFIFECHYLFPVSNYEPLRASIGKNPKKTPQAAKFAEELRTDIANQKQAALSGNKAQIVKSIKKGADDSKNGSAAVKSKPKLFKFASVDAPKALDALAAGIEKGTKTVADENVLMGKFDKQVKAAQA